MLGAIIGDIAGSIYEFHNIHTTDFEFLSERTFFTDDTVLSCAVAQGLIDGYGDEEESHTRVIAEMQKLGRRYPDAGYGNRFDSWIYTTDPQPYNSWGNGSAMRVSSVAWIYDDLADVERYAKVSAEVTHNHPEGIKGAQAVAAAIFMARTGADKNAIRAYVEDRYGYDLSQTCDEIRPNYSFDESCQGSVPQAFAAFFEGETYEEVIRLSISLGGDSDTIAAIAGGIAEALFGIPEDIKKAGLAKLTPDLKEILENYRGFLRSRER